MSPSLPALAPSEQPEWPLLREELTLHPGPISTMGAPTWTVADPATSRFYRISWLEFEILTRWDLGDPERIVQAIRRDTTIAAIPAHIDQVLHFVRAHNLVQATSAADTQRLVQQQRTHRGSLPLWLLRNFLFLRIPLWRPDRFLVATLPWVRWLFSPRIWGALAVLGAVGLYLVSRQWDHFLHGFGYLSTPSGLLAAGLTLLLVKGLHELGHGYATRYFGCRVPAMGVGLLVFLPVLWTDTTEAWKLPQRRQRLLIDAGGILTELGIAALATFLWALLPDGTLRSSVHLLASTTWIATLVINLNPFMRFDGYFLLGDWLDIANLQPRAFALGRWWLRERLFAYGDPPPEALPPGRRQLLVAYALSTWVYRCVILLSIALIIYHFFFKALGALLMVCQLGLLIARPVAAELHLWIQRRRQWRWTARTLLPLGLGTGLLALLVVPWQDRISAAAVLTGIRETTLYSPRAALVQTIHLDNGDRAGSGALLFTLQTPDLDYQIAQAQRQVELLQTQFANLSLDPQLMRRNPVLLEELKSAAADLEGLQKQRQQLVLRAPFAGLLTDVPDFLRVGGWVAANEVLGVLVDDSQGRVTAYVEEGDLDRIALDKSGTFYPQNAPPWPGVFRLVGLDRSATRLLAQSELASVAGGPLGVQQDQAGNLVPVESVYRVVLDAAPGGPPPGRAVPGRILIDAAPASLLGMLWRASLGVLIRESGW